MEMKNKEKTCKISTYLTEEAHHNLKNMYFKQLKLNEKRTQSEIANAAIEFVNNLPVIQNQSEPKKRRVTLYLSKEARNIVYQIAIRIFEQGNKTSLADVICFAINIFAKANIPLGKHEIIYLKD
jgi:hypothetical protein